MAKSSKKELDVALACEFDKALSPFTLTYKHVKCLNQTGQGFVFAYTRDNTVYYDRVEVVAQVMGIRQKPERFLLPEQVRERLISNAYSRWYFEDDDYLYPLQVCKVGTLLDEFRWVTNDSPGFRSHVVATPDTMFLRKKPLVGVRQSKVTWEDVSSKPRILKSTVRRRSVEELEPA